MSTANGPIESKERFRGQRIPRRRAIAALLVVIAVLAPLAVSAQSSPSLYGRDSDKDISVSAARSPRGVWGDGTTVWVTATNSRQIYAYTLSSGSRDSTKEFTVDSGAGVQGLWSDETTMWVVRSGRNGAGGPLPGGAKMEAYTLSDGTRDSDKDISLDSSNLDPVGLWSDETTIWTGDSDGDKLYAYTLSDGTRDSEKDFNLASSNSNPSGLWSNGTTAWVSDFSDAKLYGYNLSEGTRDSSKDFSVAVNGSVYFPNGAPRGLWSNGTTLWVAEFSTSKLTAFQIAVGGL